MPDATKYLMQQNAQLQNAKLQNDQCYLTPNSKKRKITKPPMFQKIHILCEKTVMFKFFQIFSLEISQSQFS